MSFSFHPSIILICLPTRLTPFVKPFQLILTSVCVESRYANNDSVLMKTLEVQQKM